MKVRNGFVSNSSSSSFIIMHHAPIKTISDAEELLPDCVDTFRCSYGYGDSKTYEVFTRTQIAEWLLRDIKKISIEDLKRFHINKGRSKEEAELYFGEEKQDKFTWEEFYSDTPYANDLLFEKNDVSSSEESREETAKDLFHFYTVGYSDEDGYWGNFMEHHLVPMISLKRYSHH